MTASNIALYNLDGRIAIRPCNDAARIDHIPPAVYRISIGMAGIDLVRDREAYELPERIFGRAEGYATAVVDDFISRDKSTTGAILHGLKGNGKSLTCEIISNKLIKRDMPVIVIDQPYEANTLLSIARLCAPCALLFDEFGKVYSDARKETNEREGLLPLFSDSSLKQVLFLITANTKDELNQYILDRPGRFKYCIEFTGMTKAEIATVLDEYELNEGTRTYLEVYCAINKMSYDMIKTMAKYAEKCTTRADMLDMFHLLNVPNGWAWQVAPIGIYINGEFYKGDVTWTQTNGVGVIDLYSADGEKLRQIKFDLDKDRRVDQGLLLGENGSANLVPTNVYLKADGDDVRIKLNVRYGAEDGKGGTPTALVFTDPDAKVEKKKEAPIKE